MSKKVQQNAARLVPAMRYRDPATAAEWLCAAFGFERHRVVSGDDGAIAVAQLTVGDNMIMLLRVGGSELDRVMKQPDEIGGAETQSCYVVVVDIDGLHAKAKTAGAQFVLDLKDYDNGGRGFSCRDPEGHIWNFGTYDPYEGKAGELSPPPAEKPKSRTRGRALATIAVIAAITIAVGTGGWVLATMQQTAPSEEVARLKEEVTAAQKRVREALDRAAQGAAELSRERGERQAAERVVKQVREELARQESAKAAAEALVRPVDAQLAEERRAKEAAERAVRTASDQVARERTAKQAAQNATLVVQKELAAVRVAKEIAEQSAKTANDMLAREQAAREAAERAAKEVLAKLSQAQGAGNVVPHSASASRKVFKKPGEPGSGEAMPPLLP